MSKEEIYNFFLNDCKKTKPTHHTCGLSDRIRIKKYKENKNKNKKPQL